MGIGFEGNEAGHGSNEGAQAAYIHTQEKGRPVFRIGRKHDRGRHIADKLGKEKGYPELMAPYGLPGPGAEDVQASQISDSHEEKGKEEKQLVIHLPKGLPIQENHGRHHHRHDEGQGNQTKDMKNTEEEKEKEKEGLLPWQFHFPGRQGRNDGFREKPSCQIQKKPLMKTTGAVVDRKSDRGRWKYS